MTITVARRGSDTSYEASQPKARLRSLLHVWTKKASIEQIKADSPFLGIVRKIGRHSNQEDCRVLKKYGKLGPVILGGAGGSIQLATRDSDGLVFAVKKFRSKCSIEDKKAYITKIKLEVDIGSRLHHPNIIEILDLCEADKQWHMVMEYAPYCLFETVLSRNMSPKEIDCSFLQILAGVSHVHQLGYAHRDLKLENVVVTKQGIMKIVDFGSATMCRKPTANQCTPSTGTYPRIDASMSGRLTLYAGIVGCLPYMAPEMLLQSPYDAQKVDVWSLAIIYCCMIVGRFPWKVAALADEAFRDFATSTRPNIHAERGMGRNATAPASLQISETVEVASCDLKPQATAAVPMVSVTPVKAADTRATESVQATCRLLTHLPSQSRELIRDMLVVNAQRRPTLERIGGYAWMQQSQTFSQDGGVTCHYGSYHEHVLRDG